MSAVASLLLATTGASVAAVEVTITPASQNLSGGTSVRDFTGVVATVSSGSPTAYSWGVQSGADGSIQSGGSTNTATLRITDPVQGDGPSIVTFYCDVTVGGVVYRGTCVYRWNWI